MTIQLISSNKAHGDATSNLSKFPDYFRSYNWKSKHSLYGYPPDAYLKFDWMISLEQRFSWLRNNIESERTAGLYLLKEMIHWGGNQNGLLQKFEEGIEGHHLKHLMLALIERLKEPKEAIACALNFPGIGLTYASKMLTFLDPEHYGALDTRILKTLTHLRSAG